MSCVSVEGLCEIYARGTATPLRQDGKVGDWMERSATSNRVRGATGAAFNAATHGSAVGPTQTTSAVQKVVS
jgi:hypothetical protein